MNFIRIDEHLIHLNNVVEICPRGNETAFYFIGGEQSFCTVPYPYARVLDALELAGFTTIRCQP